MADLITINDTQIAQLTYHDEPVVTFEMIAKVHGVPVSNVQKSFQRHQGRFTEGKHVYRIDHAEANQNGLGVLSNHIGARLFTEKGYLLLVKPMKDEQSWQVQERMVDEYFNMKQTLRALPTPAATRLLSHDRIELLKESFDFLVTLGMADDRDRLMYADIIRTTTRQEFLPQYATEGGMLALPAPQGFFVAERVQALGYQFTRQQEATYIAKVARLIASEYRSRYGTEPSKAQRYVDGAVRPVNWYQQEEASWADVVIQRFFADYPEIAREHAKEER